MRSNRIAALDHLRGFVTALVVLHHSLLAYCRFGHFETRHYLWSTAPIVDSSKWLGFDLIVMFNDGYFMPLMFLLSGLFVWPSLSRKGGIAYCRDRLLRLGLPFAVAVVTVMPLAWYPSFRMTGANIDFVDFWTRTVFEGPWPSGPAWFLGILLAFDLAAALLYRFVWRTAAVSPLPRPIVCFVWLATASVLSYLPFLLVAGPNLWIAYGPFAVQASRIGFYAVYFFAGVMAGRHGLGRFPVASLQQYWVWWLVVAVLLFACLVGQQAARLKGFAETIWPDLYGINFVLFCAAANFAGFAIFLRFAQRSTAWRDSLAANAYGIYILHYPVVIWTQYALLNLRLDAIVKAALVFGVALIVTWGSTIALRGVPGVARII